MIDIDKLENNALNNIISEIHVKIMDSPKLSKSEISKYISDLDYVERCVRMDYFENDPELYRFMSDSLNKTRRMLLNSINNLVDPEDFDDSDLFVSLYSELYSFNKRIQEEYWKLGKDLSDEDYANKLTIMKVNFLDVSYIELAQLRYKYEKVRDELRSNNYYILVDKYHEISHFILIHLVVVSTHLLNKPGIHEELESLGLKTADLNRI